MLYIISPRMAHLITRSLYPWPASLHFHQFPAPGLTQWNCEPCRVGSPKMDGSWWRVLTKCGPLEKGMANHFSNCALRTPWSAAEPHEPHSIFMSSAFLDSTQSEIIQCLSFSIWIISLNITPSSFILLGHFSRVRLCVTPETAAHQAPPSLGFSRQEHWSGLPFPPPVHESEKWKWSRSVVSDS